MAQYLTQGLPLRVGRDGNGAPTILTLATVDAMRGSLVISITAATSETVIDLVVEQ